MNPNWNKNQLLGKLDYQHADNFVKSYYNSPGFKQRLIRHNYKLYPKYHTPFTVDNSNGYHAGGGYWYNSKSNPDLRINAILVDYDQLSNKDDGFLNRESILSHELGHYVDDLLSNDNNSYSESYPIFRQNRALKDAVEYGYPEIRKIAKNNPNDLPYGFHDALPSESYADLMSFRNQLYRAGIYDSRKTNPFTVKHLYQFKKINPNFRLFKYFNDEQIIRMMNEVAQNNNQTASYEIS